MTDDEALEAGATMHVDGAHGEGGGQVLRSSLALAMDTGRPLIGEREVRRVLERRSWVRACGQTAAVDAHGPGNVVEVEIEATRLTERFTAFGRSGTSAERVAEARSPARRPRLRGERPAPRLIGLAFTSRRIPPAGSRSARRHRP